MSRFLIALSAGGGNIPPTLSVAKALLDRGHEVRMITDPVLEPEVSAIGAEFVSWTTAPHRYDLDPSTDLAKDWEAKTPMGSLARSRDGYFCGPARAFADDVRAEIERRPVDAAAGEMLTFGTTIGSPGPRRPGRDPVLDDGLRAGLGRAAVRPGRDPRDRVRRPPARPPALRDERPHVGQGPAGRQRRPPRARPRAAREPAPAVHGRRPAAAADDRGAQLPGLQPAGERSRHRRRGSTTRSWTEPVELPDGDAPLVLVGLSTTFMDQSAAIARIAQALGTLPVRGLITTGPAIDPASISAPANVKVVQSAPHSEVLRHADLMITHGGHGSIVKALAAGVPMVTMPFGRDQLEISARAAYKGAAVKISPKAGPEKIAAAVRSVLDDGSLPRGRTGRGADDRAENASDAAADALEQLAGTPRSGRRYRRSRADVRRRRLSAGRFFIAAPVPACAGAGAALSFAASVI